MSTRGLTGFRLEGKLYAMYNHFDSYPEGLGQDMVEFCKLVKDWNSPEIRERVSKIVLVNDDSPLKKKDIKRYAQFHSNPNEVMHQKKEDETWYWLLHELQGVAIIATVIYGKVQHMIDDADFLNDELFCEWAYIINLDEQTLEVWHDAKKLYEYSLAKLPYFMLGVTNEFKKSYDPDQQKAQMLLRAYAWGLSAEDLMELSEDEEENLTDAQVEQIDKLHNIAYDAMCQLLGDENIEWNMEWIGEIADELTEVAVKYFDKKEEDIYPYMES